MVSAPDARRVTPLQKALFAAAVLLVLVSLGGTVAILAGWSLAAPDTLPLAASAPAAGLRIADAGTFQAEGARFGARMEAPADPRADANTTERVTLWREDGSKTRVWPLDLAVRNENGTVSRGAFEVERDGPHEEYLRVTIATRDGSAGHHDRTATLRLAVYRDVGLGFWRAGDQVLTFTYGVDAV